MMDTMEIRNSVDSIKTRNPDRGFFGTVQRAGFDADIFWENTVRLIWEFSLHDDLEDIGIYLDAKDGRKLAERMLELSGSEEDAVDALFEAVQELAFAQPDKEMVAAGAPSHTDCLTSALRLIAATKGE